MTRFVSYNHPRLIFTQSNYEVFTHFSPLKAESLKVAMFLQVDNGESLSVIPTDMTKNAWSETTPKPTKYLKKHTIMGETGKNDAVLSSSVVFFVFFLDTHQS